MQRNFLLLFLLMALCALRPTVTSAQTNDTLERIERPVQKAIDTRQKTQQEEEAWRLAKEKMVARYEQLQKEQVRLKHQKTRLAEERNATRTRLLAKEKQLAHIEQISTQIQPFLDDLLAALSKRIENDLPFLSNERKLRIKKLNTLLADPEVDAGEKYRKLMEALLVEAEYGFTIETYQETISVRGRPLLADIFRLGRVALYYLRLDRKEAGFYNVATDKWEPLPAFHNPGLRAAIDIAAKRQPVELLTLPVGRLVIP